MTNIQKANQLWSYIEVRSNDYIKTLFPNGIPKKLYAAGGSRVIERNVKRVGYNFSPIWRSATPTRKDIEELKALAVAIPEFETKKVFVYWLESGGFTCEGATRLDQIGMAEDGFPMNAWTKEEIEPAIVRHKELYEPREGYLPCSYCRQQRKLEDLEQGTIISRNWASTGYRSPQRNYCKDKPCHGYDQMAHEG